MKNQDLVNLLNRAAAYLETPGDISKAEVDYLIEDLTVAAKELDDNDPDDVRVIEVVVAITMRGDADVSDVVSEMDYSFTHLAIVDTEIRDIITEI
jgi:hypothetical protein